jgi:hypothetical protein
MDTRISKMDTRMKKANEIIADIERTRSELQTLFGVNTPFVLLDVFGFKDSNDVDKGLNGLTKGKRVCKCTQTLNGDGLPILLEFLGVIISELSLCECYELSGNIKEVQLSAIFLKDGIETEKHIASVFYTYTPSGSIFYPDKVESEKITMVGEFVGTNLCIIK